jgi:hypothetical protein
VEVLEVMGMDANFTYPIILNATLIQPPQPLWKDWFPAIVSILVVILGGIITYYATITIERDKRQYEIKKQVYMDILDASVKTVFADRRIHESEMKGELMRASDARILTDLSPQLELLATKLLLCGGAIEVYEFITKKLYNYGTYTGEEWFDSDFKSKLISLMRQDLERSRHWWQFWK